MELSLEAPLYPKTRKNRFGMNEKIPWKKQKGKNIHSNIVKAAIKRFTSIHQVLLEDIKAEKSKYKVIEGKKKSNGM